MSIIGIGTDIVAVARVARLHERHRERFAKRLCAPSELVDYQALAESQKPSFLARRFAAKEAAAKALGCGIGAQARFDELIVTHTGHGAPELVFAGAAAQRAKQIGADQTHISLSDERDYAIAYVILVRWPTPAQATGH